MLSSTFANRTDQNPLARSVVLINSRQHKRRVIPANVRKFNIKSHASMDSQQNIEDVCEAMYYRGARILGISFDQPISLEAPTEKLCRRASSLSEKLAVLLEITGETECGLEVGN